MGIVGPRTNPTRRFAPDVKATIGGVRKVPEKLPRELRFKLEMIASKHEVSVRGYSTFEIVKGVAKSSNLTKSERETLNAIVEFYGADPSDLGL